MATSDEEEDYEEPDFSKDPTVQHAWSVTTLICICPGCETRNYVNLGDMHDQSAPDVEVMRCWSCQKLAWLDSEQRTIGQESGYDSIEDAYEEKGKERP